LQPINYSGRRPYRVAVPDAQRSADFLWLPVKVPFSIIVVIDFEHNVCRRPGGIGVGENRGAGCSCREINVHLPTGGGQGYCTVVVRVKIVDYIAEDLRVSWIQWHGSISADGKRVPNGLRH